MAKHYKLVDKMKHKRETTPHRSSKDTKVNQQIFNITIYIVYKQQLVTQSCGFH